MRCKTLIFTFTLIFSTVFVTSIIAFAEPIDDQPSVSRRMLVCDMWQWIGGDAVTWGCLKTPREAFVAGGPITDQVIESLQAQIRSLENRIRILEESKK